MLPPNTVWETDNPSLSEVASGLPLWQKPLSSTLLRRSWGRTSCSSDTLVIWRRDAECLTGQPELMCILPKEQSCPPHLHPLLGQTLSWNSKGRREGRQQGSKGPPSVSGGSDWLSWSQSSLVCWQSFGRWWPLGSAVGSGLNVGCHWARLCGPCTC